MPNQQSAYADISAILAQKAAGRRQRADLSFAQKLEIVDELRARVEPIIQARESRKRRRQSIAFSFTHFFAAIPMFFNLSRKGG
jgi:hypothetical protein